MRLCSACLAGIKCAYHGGGKENPKILALLKNEELMLVCPEQLGGLPTPRPATEIIGGKVVTKNGEDQTFMYQCGARRTLELADDLGIKEAIFKDGSPSCGVYWRYDGSFNGIRIAESGIVTTLLRKHGIKVISEEDL